MKVRAQDLSPASTAHDTSRRCRQTVCCCPHREKATKDQWDTNTRPLAIDKIYYDDFCSLSRWAQSEKATDGPIDFSKLTWGDGLKAINPKLVDAPPPPC